jgi:hypothetical protein
MRYPMAIAVTLFALTAGCMTAQALIALEPGKDYQMVKTEVINDDGTKSIIEEPVITKPFPKIPETEVCPTQEHQVKKVTHAKGWEVKAGLYKPQDPMFLVTNRKPDNWPIPTNPSRTFASMTTKPADSKNSFGWVITLLSLGIIGFASFKLYLHFKDEPDITKA